MTDGNGNDDVEAEGKVENLHGKVQEKLGQVEKIGWILLWALGIPIPILFISFVLCGCT